MPNPLSLSPYDRRPVPCGALSRTGAVALSAGALLAAALAVPSAAAPGSTDSTSTDATASSAGATSSTTSSAVRPEGGKFLIKGAGWGHEHGMSQWGAYAQARAGRSHATILSFYYPGTTLTTRSASTKIRVWITADDDDNLRVLPSAGLKISDTNGHSLTLPTGPQYRSWRIKRSGTGYRLSSKDAAGDYTTLATPLDTSTWTFSTKARIVKVRMPNGSTKEYRGTVSLVKRGSGARTVNKLKLDDYVRSVVPSEMPTSWSAQAVQTQAVASRTFATRTAEVTSYPGYDVCDNTNCQVYGGRATTYRSGRRVVRETKGGDAAVKATRGQILTYRGKAVLTQFAPSNGGASVSGGLPYLVTQLDPWDGKLTSQTWSRTITAASVAKAYGSVGSVEEITITRRSGVGRWGGHVYKIKITGSKKSITVSGGSFQGKLGLRSTLYTVTTP